MMVVVLEDNRLVDDGRTLVDAGLVDDDLLYSNTLDAWRGRRISIVFGQIWTLISEVSFSSVAGASSGFPCLTMVSYEHVFTSRAGASRVKKSPI